MIKLIVSDLDGTLLQDNNTVKSKDAEALKLAIQEGLQISIATGRMDTEIKEVLKSIGQKFHRISQNGAFASTIDEKSIFSNTFTTEIAEQIYKEVLHPKFVTIVCSYDTNFTHENNEYVEDIQKRMFHPIIIDPEISSKFSEVKPSKITLIGFENDIFEIHEKLSNEFKDEMDLFISETHVLDIMPKQISKGNAIKKLLAELSLNPEEIACIGDSFNDIPMFRLTPYSFVMSTAHDDVKKEAKFEVESVAEAVEMILKENSKQRV
ncbi:HAD family hydrolase [Bacillus sp. REN16]|uniref:HAD family hydrolase n=1 Tax=Bacillus sp. REN16 TaxID=2887296 RepID=UPI001E47F259|nr:HAD family hydrolase [Bacillus sp. REN16]MCC3357666.1 Cof-type HAD-IIB family hydrolase [Bacillus sp. REN16]